EHSLGKGEVESSNLSGSTSNFPVPSKTYFLSALIRIEHFVHKINARSQFHSHLSGKGVRKASFGKALPMSYV
ncbi:MAG: hypothetical protein AAFN16_21525, partial [Pseudomonadota bacterium]